LRTAGRQYLAVQFAWLPLLGEIQAWARQVEKSDQILREARDRDAQKKIKVGYSFPKIQDTTINPVSVNAAWWGGGGYNGDLAAGNVSKTLLSETWFEASYLNLVPISHRQAAASAEYANRARFLLGLQITPETLWELAPWSWAVDWVSNFGDVVSAVSNTLLDGLVMRNGFVMHHHRRETLLKAQGPHRWQHRRGDWFDTFTPTQTLVVHETKKRFSALPYFGFGSVGDFTPRQLSILAALGISRVRK
jgi:hypothetical protein